MKHKNILSLKTNHSKTGLAILLVLFTIIGVFVVFSLRAAQPVVNKEAETQALDGRVAVGANNPTASDNKYVQFGVDGSSIGSSNTKNGSRMGINVAGFPAGVSRSSGWDKIKSMGFSWARLQISYTNEDQLNLIDSDLAQARRVGMKVLVIITYDYTNNPPNTALNKPNNPQEWANFAGRVAAYWKVNYADVVAAIEVWNEPNNPAFWRDVNANDYADLLRRSYLTIKQNHPTIPILMGGLAATNGSFPANESNDLQNPATYLKKLYEWNEAQGRNGSEGLFDIANNHPYDSQSDETNAVRSPYRATHYMRQVMNSFNDNAKLIWGTEAGWPSCVKAYGFMMNEDRRAVRALTDLNDWWYGKHELVTGETTFDENAPVLDWNTGPFFVFKTYKTTPRDPSELAFGLIYNTKEFMATNSDTEAQDLCKNPPTDFYGPQIIQTLRDYSNLNR